MGNPVTVDSLKNAAVALTELARQVDATAELRAVSRTNSGAEVRIGTDSGCVAGVVEQLRLRVPLVRVEAREDLLHAGKELVVALSDRDEWLMATERARSLKTLRLLRASAVAALVCAVCIQLATTVPALHEVRAHVELLADDARAALARGARALWGPLWARTGGGPSGTPEHAS